MDKECERFISHSVQVYVIQIAIYKIYYKH
jgi:hypothetical protein